MDEVNERESAAQRSALRGSHPRDANSNNVFDAP